MILQKNLFSTLIFIIITSCGFKVVDQNFASSFNIEDINFNGDKRINYLIKNKLNTRETNVNKDKKSITLNIDSKMDRNIKEKNIKNEITKYEVAITTQINIILLGEKIERNFSIIKSGDYDVANKYSDTLANEKSLIRSLSKEIAEQIINNLLININDL